METAPVCQESNISLGNIFNNVHPAPIFFPPEIPNSVRSAKKQLLSLLATDFVDLDRVAPDCRCLTTFFAKTMQVSGKDTELINMLGRAISSALSARLVDETVALSWLHQLYSEAVTPEAKYWTTRFISDHQTTAAYNQLAALVLDRDGDFVAQQMLANAYKMVYAISNSRLLESMKLRINLFPKQSQHARQFVAIVMQI